ncbi:MAG: inorganic phosphate transporter [Isosphaeraceae bacterium]
MADPRPRALHPAAGLARRPPWWIRAIPMTTCGGVSPAHGSNDGQKGMGLIMLVLIGLMPTAYALNLKEESGARRAGRARPGSSSSCSRRTTAAAGGRRATRGPDPGPRGEDVAQRGPGRAAAGRAGGDLPSRRVPAAGAARDGRLDSPELKESRRELRKAVEYVPGWVILGASALPGRGDHLRISADRRDRGREDRSRTSPTPSACAELVAMATIGLADIGGMPVSTTHVLSPGVAGTMYANNSGVQLATIRKIGLAWVLTLPASMLLSAGLYFFGHLAMGS